MKVETKIKLFNELCQPEYKTEGAAACDCIANLNAPVVLKPGEGKLIPLGFALEMPKGFKAEVTGRSSSYKEKLVVWPGKIDNDYRGEVKASVMNLSSKDIEILPYARFAQLEIMSYDTASFVVQDELSGTDRGNGGFGSTGV